MDQDLLSSVPFDDLIVDDRKGPYREHVSSDVAGRLAETIGVPHRVVKVPPAYFPIAFLKALRSSMGGIPAGSILAKQELEFHAEVAVDSDLLTTTWIGQKYVRRDRPFVVIEFDVRDEHDQPVVTGRKTIVWPTGPEEAK